MSELQGPGAPTAEEIEEYLASYWVVLDTGQLLEQVTPEEYDRLSDAGRTLDGGRNG